MNITSQDDIHLQLKIGYIFNLASDISELWALEYINVEIEVFIWYFRAIFPKVDLIPENMNRMLVSVQQIGQVVELIRGVGVALFLE